MLDADGRLGDQSLIMRTSSFIDVDNAGAHNRDNGDGDNDDLAVDHVIATGRAHALLTVQRQQQRADRLLTQYGAVRDPRDGVWRFDAVLRATAHRDIDLLAYLSNQTSNNTAATFVLGDRAWTISHFAARDGRLDVLHCLFVAGLLDPVRQTTNHGASLAHIAAHYGRIDVLKWLRSHGLLLDVRMADYNGFTPVTVAALARNWDVLFWMRKASLISFRTWIRHLL